MPPLWRNRTVLMADLAVAAWAIVWIVLGVVVAREVRQLDDLSDTVVTAGEALDQTGDGLRGTSDSLREIHRALQILESLPIVGREIEENLEGAAATLDGIAAEVEETARSAQASGRVSKESTADLSVILGLAVALVPTLTLFAAYAPFRSLRLRRALGLNA
jgi:uncharacterized protein YoxC